jgi:hypothetical protein
MEAAAWSIAAASRASSSSPSDQASEAPAMAAVMRRPRIAGSTQLGEGPLLGHLLECAAHFPGKISGEAPLEAGRLLRHGSA